MQNCTRGVMAVCWGLKCTYVQTNDRHMTYGKERSMVEWAWKISLHEISSVFSNINLTLHLLISFSIEFLKVILMLTMKYLNCYLWHFSRKFTFMRNFMGKFLVPLNELAQKLIPILIYVKKTSFVTSDLVFGKTKTKMTTSILQRCFISSFSNISRKFSVKSSVLTKIEVLPKISLTDERLSSTILSELKPNQKGNFEKRLIWYELF